MFPESSGAFWGLPGEWCGDGRAQKEITLSRFLVWLRAGLRRYHTLYKVMNTRTLKIETAGDFFYGRVSPKIRLSGRWLERAGFKPGHRVEVQVCQPGTLTLHFRDQSNLRQ